MSLDYEITPDPEAEEATAIIAALERAVAEDGTLSPPADGAWSKAGREMAAGEVGGADVR